MALLIESGDNYRIEREGGLALCRVWSRPDLDFETGARLAAKKVGICSALAAGDAKGLLFDLREAPKVTGPKTQKALEQILAAWEAAARPIAIVVSPVSLQRLQLTRISRAVAPQHAQVFLDSDSARAWLIRRWAESRRPSAAPSTAPAAPSTAPPASSVAPPASSRAGAKRRG